jgi:predicted permease
MSVRAALGAGRFRLARQVLTESLLLGFVSGAIGLVLAWAAFDVLVASLPITSAFQETLELDRAALVGGLVLALLSGSLIALVPLRSLLAGEVPGGALRVRTQGGAARGRMRLQTSLVGAEVLLAVVLAAGASLLVRSVEKLRAIDTGLDPAGVLTLEILLSESSSSSEERALFFARLLERAHALPGVTAAGYINRLPLRDGGWQAGIGVPDRPDLDGAARPTAMFRPVSPEAFAALGVQLVEGRGILPTDAAGAPHVAVINQTFARRIWGSESPVGKTYFTGFASVPSVEVVGVVKDLAVETLTGEQPMVGFYAWAQAMPSSGFGILVVKSSGSASALAPALRAGVAEIEPRAAIGRIETMDEALDVEMAEPLRLRFFLGLFSLLGVVLGSVGVYGVVSYSVERRRTEYGIRMALGASSAGLVGLVVRQGMLPVVVGVSMGTAVALAASEALARFLFDVAPTDPLSFAMAAAALLLTGAVAALVPALRASATPPGVALRSE